jgi:hypothetical protein
MGDYIENAGKGQNEKTESDADRVSADGMTG